MIATFCLMGRRGRVRFVPITTNVVSSNPAQSRCTQYSGM